MENILHQSHTRGHANHGWLDSHHTFSFAGYFNPERVHFGAIRVFNDDVVIGGAGFGTHPHANMEIVSIPLSGALEHKDSTGRQKIIKTGEVQIMSAGTGIEHSEYNASKEDEVNFLQIWILPDKMNIEPRYDQREFSLEHNRNQLINVVAPDNPQALWINQKTWFYLGEIEMNHEVEYKTNESGNGIYLFVIEGQIEIADKKLQKRDGMGITGVDNLVMSASKDSRLLLIETTLKI
jgi:redox-sensitive bicupin YhaK (pirin superfamily)